MSFSTILSAVIEGLEVAFIHVEADISNGLPVFHMVGYLSSEVKEAGERVRTAIKNSGFEYPAKRTVVNYRRTQPWGKREESIRSFADHNGSEGKRGEKVYRSA